MNRECTNPMAHSLSCSRWSCGEYWKYCPGLPTRWRSVSRYQISHTVLPRHSGLTLIRPRHCQLEWDVHRLFCLHTDMDSAETLVCSMLYFLLKKNTPIIIFMQINLMIFQTRISLITNSLFLVIHFTFCLSYR